MSAGYRSNDSKETKDKYIGYRIAMYVKNVSTEKAPVTATLVGKNTSSTSFELTVNTQNAENGIASIQIYANKTLEASKTYTDAQESKTIEITNKTENTEYTCYAIVIDGAGNKVMTNVLKITTVPVYYWAKYDIKESNNTYVLEKVRTVSISVPHGSVNEVYGSATLNEYTGEITFGGLYNKPENANYINKYMVYERGENNEITKIAWLYLYEGRVNGSCKYKAEIYEIKNNISFGQGENYLEEVISTNSNAYPSDGYKDGFWYVSQGEKNENLPVYYWQKYNLKDKYGYGMKKIEENVIVSYGIRSGYRFCTVDPDTGEIKLDGHTGRGVIGVWNVTTNSSGVDEITRIVKDPSVSYYYTIYSDNIEQQFLEEKYIVSNSVVVGSIKGDKCIGEVKSTNPNAYPSDGEQNGYWYVYSREET